jgi:hypothetical protein
VATLAYFRRALGFRLYAYAVLPGALEAVIQPGHGEGQGGTTDLAGGSKGPATISKIMMEIKGSFAHWHNRRHRRRGSVWEKRFRDELLLSAEEIRAAVMVVHQRPVALGLAERPELYRYSGLSAGRNPIALIDALPVRVGDLPALAAPLRRAV